MGKKKILSGRKPKNQIGIHIYNNLWYHLIFQKIYVVYYYRLKYIIVRNCQYIPNLPVVDAAKTAEFSTKKKKKAKTAEIES